MKWSAAHLAIFSPHPHRAHCRGSKVWSGVSTWARPRLQTQWCASASRTGRGSDPCWRCRPEPSAGSPASSASWWFTARSKVGSPPLNHEAEWIQRTSHSLCLFCFLSSVGVRSMHSTDIQWSAILSWGYADNILRLKSKQSEPPINFIQCSQLHQVRSSENIKGCCQWTEIYKSTLRINHRMFRCW